MNVRQASWPGAVTTAGSAPMRRGGLRCWDWREVLTPIAYYDLISLTWFIAYFKIDVCAARSKDEGGLGRPQLEQFHK